MKARVFGGEEGLEEHTSFSNTQAFSFRSSRRHCHSCWLLFSRQDQWARNSWRQDLLISSRLFLFFVSNCLLSTPLLQALSALFCPSFALSPLIFFFLLLLIYNSPLLPSSSFLTLSRSFFSLPFASSFLIPSPFRTKPFPHG